MKRRIVSIMLSTAMVMSMTGIASAEATTEGASAAAFTAGTYTGVGTGHNGEVKVEVTVSDSAIENIVVTETNESSGFGEVASDRIIDEVLTYQSLDVDGVSGCTISRAAFMTAIQDALTQAGADIDALKAVEIPAKVGEERTIDTDVVVIGSGAAGMCAAIEAAYAGAKVTVLEKLARNGGSTRMSSAMLVAGGTKLQEEAGIEDSVENLKAYWLERGEGNVDEEQVNFVAENINDALDWFIDLGVNYNKDLILYSGTADVARAHMPVESGRELMDRLVEEAEKNGVEILTETPALELTQDEDGNVTGVIADDHGAQVTVNAKSTVIATGGFGWNQDMLEKYSPDAVGTWSVSSPGSTGDGITLAEAVGADTVFKGGYIGWKVASPVYDQSSAIGAPMYGAANLVVNAEGNRFGDESLDYPFMFEDMVKDGSDIFYFIFDSGDKESKDLVNNTSDTVATLEAGVEAGVVTKADTIEELAEALGLTDLAATVEQFNNSVDSGVDEAFGRNTTTMAKIENGPFYAMQTKKATLGTFGGLNIDLDAAVVTADEEKIPGLYAAGEVANGEFFPKIYPASGSAMDVAVVFGRQAGRSAAAYALGEEVEATSEAVTE